MVADEPCDRRAAHLRAARNDLIRGERFIVSRFQKHQARKRRWSVGHGLVLLFGLDDLGNVYTQCAGYRFPNKVGTEFPGADFRNSWT